MVNGITYKKIDASFGDATEKGVKDFQNSAGIAIDGCTGTETFDKLLS